MRRLLEFSSLIYFLFDNNLLTYIFAAALPLFLTSFQIVERKIGIPPIAKIFEFITASRLVIPHECALILIKSQQIEKILSSIVVYIKNVLCPRRHLSMGWNISFFILIPDDILLVVNSLYIV